MLTARCRGSIALLVGLSTLFSVAPLAAQPANDDFDAAEVIADIEGSSDGTTEDATVEAEEPAHGGVQCGKSVWYRWTAPETTAITFRVETEASFFVAAYQGEFLDTIELIGSNGAIYTQLGTIYSPAATQAISVQAIEGTTYSIAVDTNPTFDCEAAPFSIRWSRAEGPPNDFYVDAEEIGGIDGSLTAALDGATFEGEALIPVQTIVGPVGFSSANSVWYRWTAPTSACTILTAEGGFARARIGIFRPADSPGALRAANLLAREENVNGTVERLQLRTVAGTEYAISLGTIFENPTGPVSYRWTFAGSGPVNDNFADAQPLQGASGTVEASNIGATKECDEPARRSELDSLGLSGPSIWFRWTAPASERVVFATPGSDFDTLVWIYQGNSLGELIERGSNDDIDSIVEEGPETKTSFTAFDAVEGEEYFIAVDGWNLDEGNVVLSWAAVPENDDFENAQRLSGSTGIAMGNNLAALSEFEEPSHAGVEAGHSAWFIWQAPATGRVNFQLSAVDGLRIALLAAYTGDFLPELNTIASIDGATLCTPQCSDARLNFVATAGTTYFIAVSGRQDAIVPLAPPLNVGPFFLTWFPPGVPTPTRIPTRTPTITPTRTNTVAPTPTRTRRPSSTPTRTGGPTPTPGPPYGDVNCDDFFSAADLTELMRLIPTGGPSSCVFADANQDGSIDAADLAPTLARIFQP